LCSVTIIFSQLPVRILLQPLPCCCVRALMLCCLLSAALPRKVDRVQISDSCKHSMFIWSSCYEMAPKLRACKPCSSAITH
jgi:hypothetical protein